MKTSTPQMIVIPAGTKAVPCRGATCHAMIFFVKHPKTGRISPVSTDCEGGKRPSMTKDVDQGDLLNGVAEVYDGIGQSHFLDCPDVDEFSRGGAR